MTYLKGTKTKTITIITKTKKIETFINKTITSCRSKTSSTPSLTSTLLFVESSLPQSPVFSLPSLSKLLSLSSASTWIRNRSSSSPSLLSAKSISVSRKPRSSYLSSSSITTISTKASLRHPAQDQPNEPQTLNQQKQQKQKLINIFATTKSDNLKSEDKSNGDSWEYALFQPSSANTSIEQSSTTETTSKKTINNTGIRSEKLLLLPRTPSHKQRRKLQKRLKNTTKHFDERVVTSTYNPETMFASEQEQSIDLTKHAINNLPTTIDNTAKRPFDDPSSSSLYVVSVNFSSAETELPSPFDDKLFAVIPNNVSMSYTDNDGENVINTFNCDHPLLNLCNLRYSISWTIVLFIAYLIVFVIGLVGNLSVLWIVYMLKGESKRRHSSHLIATSVIVAAPLPPPPPPPPPTAAPAATTNGIGSTSISSSNLYHSNNHAYNNINNHNNGINSGHQPYSHHHSQSIHHHNLHQQHYVHSFNNSNSNNSGNTTPNYYCTHHYTTTPVISINRANAVFYRFVCNLALADLLVVLFCLPPTLIGNIYLPWVLGRVVCKAVPYLQGVSVNASVYTLMAISIDRFYAIYYPLSKKCSTAMCWCTIMLIWIVSFAISFPWLVYFEVIPVNGSEYHPALNYGKTFQVCRDIWPSLEMEKAHFLVVNLGLQYLIPLSVIAFFYILILKKIAERKLPKLSRHMPPTLKDGNRQSSLVIERSKVKVFKCLIVLVLLFALSWLPLYIIFFIIKIGPRLDDHSVVSQILDTGVPVAQWLGASNSCVNPILYFFFNAKWRSYYRNSWLKTFSCLSSIRLKKTHFGGCGGSGGGASGREDKSSVTAV